MSKVIVRIKGGVGNQLFCYAAARRLAIVNKSELVLDNVTGFVRDHKYRRQFLLDKFHIPARKAMAVERLEPFERYRRSFAKVMARRRPFEQRRYVEQEGKDFNPRLLDLKVSETVYLDGYWQSEGYFKDVEKTIRKDLKMEPPNDSFNRRMAEKILNCNSVAVHCRWFDPPDNTAVHNAPADYYHRAINEIERHVDNPQYFIFSDDPQAARSMLGLHAERVVTVDHNRGDENVWVDLWLMTLCKDFIIANSTFSWWGAWLGESDSTIVVAPGFRVSGITSWGFDGLIQTVGFNYDRQRTPIRWKVSSHLRRHVLL